MLLFSVNYRNYSWHMHLHGVLIVFQYTWQEILNKYLEGISPSLFSSKSKRIHNFLPWILTSCAVVFCACDASIFLPTPLSFSLPPLSFSLLSSNQEIWPLTLQVFTIKPHSYVAYEKQHSCIRWLTSVFKICWYSCSSIFHFALHW